MIHVVVELSRTRTSCSCSWHLTWTWFQDMISDIRTTTTRSAGSYSAPGRYNTFLHFNLYIIKEVLVLLLLKLGRELRSLSTTNLLASEAFGNMLRCQFGIQFGLQKPTVMLSPPTFIEKLRSGNYQNYKIDQLFREQQDKVGAMMFFPEKDDGSGKEEASSTRGGGSIIKGSRQKMEAVAALTANKSQDGRKTLRISCLTLS